MMPLRNKDILYDKPLIAYVENFMTTDDCYKFIDFAKPKLKKSMVIEKGLIKADPSRNSSEVWIQTNKLKTNEFFRKNVSEFFDVPCNTFETTIVINYKHGQQYRAHYDYDLHSSVKRRATAICYLNNVAEGGETIFPDLNISVKPKKGALLYFQYDFDDESINKKTLHAGSPVISNDEKWITTIWMKKL